MPANQSTLKGHLTLHLIVAIFLAVPVAVTWQLPTTWISLDRAGGGVSLKARVCLLFAIPFRTVELSDVEAVDSYLAPGPPPQRTTRRIRSRAIPMGTVVVSGPGGEAEFPVAAKNIGPLKERLGGFLADPSARDLSFVFTAHRGISVFCGVWATIFIGIYAIYVLSWIIPQQIQWRFVDWVFRLLPAKGRRQVAESIRAAAAERSDQ
ncbi:MAG: hypothetical protein R3F11_19050 [Verrucomicrobiales bacterium]